MTKFTILILLVFSTNEYRMLQIEKKNANWKVTQTTNFE